MFKGETFNYGLDLFNPNLMTDLYGFIWIGLISFIILSLALKWPSIYKIILTALSVRILVIIVGHYFVHLPDATADALGYEWGAWNMAKDGFFNVFNNFTGPRSDFYSWVMAIPYSLFGRNVLIIQSIGLCFGVGSVFLGWFLAREVWDERTANKVGWVLALFPTLVLYSVITLKEVYCSFFVLVAMIGAVRWCKTKNYKSAYLSILGFFIAGFFHGPLFLGGFIFSAFFCFSILNDSYKLLLNYKINLKNFLIIILISFVVIAFLNNKIYIPYLGTFEGTIDINRLIDSIRNRNVGHASYPEWLIATTPTEFFYKGLIRILYLLFNPFPWAVKEPIHLIGAIDSLLYMLITLLIIFNFKLIWGDSALKMMLIILMGYLFMYGIGVSNFGAGIRHRSKFIIEMLILAAPLIPTFVFSKKNGSNKYYKFKKIK